MEIFFNLLGRTEVLVVDTVEHEFRRSGDDSVMFMMKMAQWMTCVLILATNVPLIIFIMKVSRIQFQLKIKSRTSLIMQQKSMTFLDRLVVLDCGLCISNVYILIHFGDISGVVDLGSCAFYVFMFFQVNLINKLLTLGIVIYRFALVLCSSVVRTPYQRKSIENCILMFIFWTSFILTSWAFYYREDSRQYLGKGYTHSFIITPLPDLRQHPLLL